MNRMKKIGKVQPLAARQKNEKLGIGLEKLDRAVFDPKKTYDALAELGVYRVRLQSGWMRTEKQEGTYDFEWLDEIVDELIKRKMKPWLCLCYGNPLYSPAAKTVFGAVGAPPIFSERERAAWDDYCTAVARHFDGRVDEFEVWNEPDGIWCWKHGINGAEYGAFAVRTAKAVKKGQSNAKILAGSMCCRANLGWLREAFEQGMGEHIHSFTYHDYCEKETRVPETAQVLRTIIDEYNPSIKLVQGETGCPSRHDGHGALEYGNWTQEKQAKLLLRRVLTEYKLGVDFISWFTAVDMIEALNGNANDKASYLDYGYFGVLAAQFDENGFSIGEYAKKQSFFALQTLSSVLDGASVENLPVMLHWTLFTYKSYAMTEESDTLCTVPLKKQNGAAAYAYWKPCNVLTETYSGFTTLIVSKPLGTPRLVDLSSGEVYQIPDEMIKPLSCGAYRIELLPVKDAPLLLTFGDFVNFA